MSERLLGLPVRSRLTTLAAASALLGYYLLTMSRGLSMYDSGELALVAEQFGLGHPFGQPLHTMLGALLSRIPGIEPLFALNALSALAGAFTLIPVTSFAEALVRPEPDCPDADARIIAPMIALVGMHPALWEPATRIEVYPLAVFFAMWAAARLAHAVMDCDQSRRPYFLTGLALGLSASANVICATGVAIAMAPRLVMGTFRREVPKPAIALATAGGLVGLLSYAYVLIVAQRTDVVVWGAPRDATTVRNYFTASDFSYKQVASFTEWWGHVQELFMWGVHNSLVWLMLAGFLGYALFARRRALGRFFFVANLTFFVAFLARDSMFAPDVLDYLGYLSIPTWIAASGIGLLVAFATRRRTWLAGATVAVVLLLVVTAPPQPLSRTRHLDTFTDQAALAALQAAPPNAVLIVERDHWVGPMWYLQEQRNVRPDVTLLAYGLASSMWYWEHLFDRHPELNGFALRGPGGRGARVKRFLAANPDRPVQIERVELAERLRLRTCRSPWLLDVAHLCPGADGSAGADADANPAVGASPVTAQASTLIHLTHNATRILRDGSPGTEGLLALVTLDRGHDLWSQGFPRAAIASLLSGVVPVAGLEDVELSSVPPQVTPQPRPHPRYEPRVALGHPARNVHYASVIARASGANGLAKYLALLADHLGPVTPKFANPSDQPATL